MWIEGCHTELHAALRELKGVMQEYGVNTGQRLNVSNCAAILQGDSGPMPLPSLEGILVELYVGYLGWHLGNMAPYD